MNSLLSIVSWKYNPSNRQLKLFYSDGGAELYHPVPAYLYDNLLRRQDKLAFVEKYLLYNLNFKKIYTA